MVTIEISDWKERWLDEQVRALRHLPPGTWLPEPHYQPERDLLAGLLRLRDETDPLRWLQDNHGSLIAQVLMWTALDRIRALVQGVRLAAHAGHGVPIDNHQQWLGDLLKLLGNAEPFQRLIDTHLDKHQQWLGDLLKLSGNAEPFQRLNGTHPTTTSPELLHNVFQTLRAVRQESPARPAFKVVGDDILRLLDGLFRLPETTDPLLWIQDEHSHLAAIKTLCHVLDQIRPSRSLLVGKLMDGQVTKVHCPNLRLRAGKLPVVLREVILGKTGFTLTLQTRIPKRLLRKSVGTLPLGRGIRWQGVERVTDDLGYHYFVCYRLEEGGSRLWWHDRSLQLVCYPAIASTATEITLSSNGMSFVIVGLRPGEPDWMRRALHHVHLGDLTWRVKVAE